MTRGVGGRPVWVISTFRERPGKREPPREAEDSLSGNPQTGGKQLPGIAGPVIPRLVGNSSRGLPVR